MKGTSRLTGQTIGAVIVALLLTLGSGDMAPRIGLGVAAVLTLASGLISVLRVPAKAEGAAKVVSSAGPA
jgi:DHA2 family multidrug resistance protein-like MFS transporter